MPDYRIRIATLDDRAVLVHQRVAMFTDMGVPIDAGVVADVYGRWLDRALPSQIYHAWVVDAAEEGRVDAVVAGSGIIVLPWPPGPRSVGDQLAFVYNVYTEPEHRRRGLGRLVMEAIHSWCRGHGVNSIGLNASADGRPLYESMGYRIRTNPMMLYAINEAQV